MISLFPADAASEPFQNVPENRIALKLSHSDVNSLTPEQFRKAKQIGIDLLEVSFPTVISHSLLSDFYLLLDTKEHFLTVYELDSDPEPLINSIQSGYNTVPNQLRDNIAAVKLLGYPADYDERFPSAIRDFLSQISASIDKPLYYQSAFFQPPFRPAGFDFISGRIIVRDDSLSIPREPVLLFEPSGKVTESLQMLEHILNHSLSHSESIVIIPAEWFFARMEAQEAFSEIISFYLNGNTIIFPMPAGSPESPRLNWPVLFLLVIWASFIIHYKYQPMYKAALPRYFFNHSFFVHDTMELRIRNTSSGVIVLIQHALLTGFFFYLLADAFISKTGLQALANHFPLFFYPGLEELCLFLIGLTIALFSHIISLAWLYVFNKQLNHPSQVVNLYSWPLHLNFVIVTLVVYFVQLSSAHNWLIVAASAYFLVWFFSFKIAATDSAKYLEKRRTLYLVLTVGIHFLLIIIALVLIFWLPFLFEPLEMAFLLP